MSVVKQGGKHRIPNLTRMCFWDRDKSRAQLIFYWFVSKNAIFVSECAEDLCLVKNKSNMHLGDDGAKELVIICDLVYFSHENEWTQDGV